MMKIQNRKTSGFTLVELAIVLGIAGVLFGGVWKLVSSSNVQMRDQAAAKQHAQIADAVGSFLSNESGQQWLAGKSAASPTICSMKDIVNGTGSGCDGMDVLRDALDRMGIDGNAVSPYGQSYAIGVRRADPGDPVGSEKDSPANSYSFMVITYGGDPISDTSGGRVSSMMGADGGFVFSQHSCTPPGTPGGTACGAYGGWASELNYYFSGTSLFNPGNHPGHVASRTFVSSLERSTEPWLARLRYGGSISWNTMHTDLYLGGGERTNEVWFGRSSKEAHDQVGTVMNVQGGTINLGHMGKIYGDSSSMKNRDDPFIHLQEDEIDAVGKPSKKLLQVWGRRCRFSSQEYSPENFEQLGCEYTAEISGDVTVQGMVQAYSLFATRFIYESKEMPSDIRLKTDIVTVTNSLNELMKLRPVSFKFKSSGKDSTGFIAQEVEKVYPKLVSGSGDETKLLNYDGFFAPIVDAIQILKKENDELKAELAKQAEAQKKLEAEIQAIISKK